MKFYVVGIYSRLGSSDGPKVYGDALVYATDRRTALSMVSETGWIPNHGDIYLLGTEREKEVHDYMSREEIELAKDKAREEGVAIIWSSGG